MRPSRRLAIALGALAALLLLLLVALPLALRGRVATRVKEELARSFDARFDWRAARLGLLGDFPSLTLRLEQPSVVGVGAFAGDTLVHLRELRLVLDLASVLRSLTRDAPVVVREIALDRPVARLRVLTDGRASWDIARVRADTGGGALDVTLRELRIADGVVVLDDRETRTEAALAGLSATMRGDFATERFALAVRARADTASLRFAGVPYLARTALALDAKVDADLPAHRFTLDGVTLRLNRLALAVAGTVTTAGPAPVLDLRVSSPSTAFADILSLVPALYRRDFERLRTSGRMAVTGRLRGAIRGDTLPAFALRARVEEGAFLHPSLPLPARDIALDLALDNPGGVADRTVVTLDRLRGTIGGRRLDGRLVLRTPVSDPEVDARLTGSLDLADLARTVPLENAAGLAGVLAADVAVRARLSDVDARRYERVDARGALAASRVTLRAAALPRPLAIDTGSLRLTPRAAELSALVARLGASDVRASGVLENLLGVALRGDALRALLTIRSRRVDLAELIPQERSAGVIPVPPRVDLALDAAIDRLDWGTIAATDVRGELRVKDERVTLDSLHLGMMRGQVLASGFYDTKEAASPRYDVTLRLADVDVPAAFASLVTVQRLAPIARRAQGTVAGAVRMTGTMESAMVPVFSQLDGQGELAATRLGLQGSRVFDRLAETLALAQLREPAIGALRLTYALEDGRVTVRPFAARVGGIPLTIGGSHGVDGTLGYELQLVVPRALVEGATRGALTRLAARAGRAGIDLSQGEGVTVTARVTGTMTDPRVDVGFAGIATSLREAAREAVRRQVETQTATVRARVDSAVDAARERARAEAEGAIAAAESEAEAMRARARALSDSVRRRAGERADSLVARASNPVARRAAQLAADRAKREADQQAERLLRGADARADSLVARARQRADSIVGSPAWASGAARP